jgi:hypothetical protein
MPISKPLFLSLSSLLLLAACQDKTPTPDKLSVAPTLDSVAGNVAAATADSDTARAAPSDTKSPARAAVDTPAKATATTKRTGPDSAIMLAVATQPKLRSQNDSISLVAAIRAGLKSARWPVALPPPLPGSILPAKRIVAFYGNPLSKKMGILGEIPYDQMLAKLDTVVAQWRAADPTKPVLPALHLIVSVAQGTPGKDSMYRQRSDPDLIEKIYGFAKARGAITILDIQTGKSTLQAEIPVLIPFLSRPDVHLGIDPEFNMHYSREGRIPGTKIGTFDAKDVNYAIDQLAALVTKYHLPPKVLIVHRFTTNMLQHADQIKHDPRVQVVINMDGWGQPWLKFDTYRTSEVAEPVQYTGFKIFFHNDTKKGDPILAPREVLALRPRPLYIQYQ